MKQLKNFILENTQTPPKSTQPNNKKDEPYFVVYKIVDKPESFKMTKEDAYPDVQAKTPGTSIVKRGKKEDCQKFIEAEKVKAAYAKMQSLNK